MREFDIRLQDGRTLHAYDTHSPESPSTTAVVWHHGTPNIGLPPEPLFATSDRLGIRWIGYDRPGYGGSDPLPGRDVASAAADVAMLADALDLDRFAVMGHSGGGPHALACAAILADRVTAAVAGASLAPRGAAGLDWFAGMAPSAEAALRAAVRGQAAKEAYEAAATDAAPAFVPADEAALEAEWGWFGKVVGPALASGPAPLIADDLAYVAPWGFEPERIGVPVLLLHGEGDRMVPATHGKWLATHVPAAEIWLEEGAGHISILRRAPEALEWLAGHARRR